MFALASHSKLHKFQTEVCNIQSSAKDLNDIETRSMEYYFTFYPVFNHTHANIRISLDLIPSTYLAVDAHSSSIKPAEGV